ncbi:MAG: hypothetical protein JWM33_1520 [Caulobacteraceae bacterium]|nr:hypothetical protein [Caulobacteraceae bacterium]
MEEILASIRRIISEDEAPASDAPAAVSEPEPAADLLVEAAPEPAAVEEDDDILDLTQPMDEPEAFAPAPEPAPRVATPSVSETMGDLEAYIAAPAVTAAPAPAPRAAPQADESLLSGRTAASVSSAFGQLSSAMAMPAPGRTLEDVTRELLRPLLKEWLDQNLSRIVEAKVAEEVERVSRTHR